MVINTHKHLPYNGLHNTRTRQKECKLLYWRLLFINDVEQIKALLIPLPTWCVFLTANGCFAHCLLVEIIFSVFYHVFVSFSVTKRNKIIKSYILLKYNCSVERTTLQLMSHKERYTERLLNFNVLYLSEKLILI